jgi:acyl-CoA synthetase (AMP-forming)/AMP-acid ligase II
MTRSTVLSPADCVTLTHLLRLRAARTPDRAAYTFLLDGENEAVAITYGELDRQARAIAAALHDLRAAGERALLLYPPGLEFVAAFMGCLYAGVVAVPAYPPPPNNRPIPRIQAIVADAEATLALTTTPILATMERRFGQVPSLASLSWRATDALDAGIEYAWPERVGEGQDLAFLQYTSGSTAAPKGAMVSHENVLANARMLQASCRHTEESVHVCWLPIYHDMGLIAHVIQSLYVGAPCVLMPSVAFLQRPVRWLQAISRYGADTSGAPNFAYDLCAAKVSPEQKEALDLSGWRVAGNAAEPVRASTIDAFVAAFEPCGFRREAFYPCYGLAEATVFATGGTWDAGPVVRHVRKTALQQRRVVPAAQGDDDAQALVGCGHGWLEQQIVIVDPDSLVRCPPDRIGEIWVSGPHVAGGYWARPEESAQAFNGYLAESGEGPFLRTGDLGFILDDELFITGRLKDLIIIRGRNYYPQDLERTVEQCHPLLRPASGAAFAVEAEGEERLVIVQEVERQSWDLDVAAVVKSIRQAVSEQHELHAHDVVLIKTGSIPKTTSGKIQRGACRERYLAGTLDVRRTA